MQSKHKTHIAAICAVMWVGTSAQAHHQSFRATQLIGANVATESGEEVGEVEDMVVMQTGEIKAVLSVEQDGRNKMIALDEENLTYTHDDQAWTVNMTMAELQSAPEFSYDDIMVAQQDADADAGDDDRADSESR